MISRLMSSAVYLAITALVLIGLGAAAYLFGFGEAVAVKLVAVGGCVYLSALCVVLLAFVAAYKRL